MTNVRTIAVLGAGDMGHGVAELAAIKGLDVRLRDVNDEVLQKAMQKVRTSLDKLVQKQQLTHAEADAAFARIRTTTHLEQAVGGADLVIEAVPEKLDLKQRVFAEVESAAPAHAVLATNTSAMRVREIGEKLRDPTRLVGMHFFNPVLLMDLVEIIPSPSTSPAALKVAEEVSKKLGKTTVTLQQDTPGFVTSRLVGVWVGAAVLCEEAKLGTKEQIDAALRFKAGFPMGPFELADYTGLDIGLHASDYIASRLGDAYKAMPALRAQVEKGLLGKKSGRGFYEWQGSRMTTTLSPETGTAFDPALVLSVVANEAAKLVEQGVATPEQIDLAMRHGCAFPQGPLEWADEVGLDVVAKHLARLEEKTAHPLVEPYEMLVEMVQQKKLGKKSGQGFYAHKGEGVREREGPGYETLLVAVDAASRVGTITLHRPHRLNALNGQLIAELRKALAQMDEDANVRVVVITGSGDKAFCAGADLTDVSATAPFQVAELARQGHRMCLDMEKLGKPVIAAINGLALGGGLELALPADFRLAAKRAKLGLPEVTLGLLPAMGGTQRLPRLVGLAAAKEIALLGDRIDAQKALQLGLVHRVFDNETFEADVKAFAIEVASRAPLSLKFTKQLLNAAPTTDILVGLEAEASAFGVLSSTEDVVEGVTSLFGKKKPEFQGK